MGLQNQFERTGNWLFRFRSYVPLVLLLPFLVKMTRYQFPWASRDLHEVVHWICIAVTTSGLIIRFTVAGYAPDGTSGRNTREQIARSLNTTGLYSLVRHPLYLGNFLMWAGIPLFCLDPWLMLVFGLAFCVYYERIMFAEEQFLRRQFGEAYQEWAAQTPAFFPRFSGWIPSNRSFSWRRACRQEYTSFFLAVQAMVAVELLEHWAVDHRFVFETPWIIFSTVGLIVYLAVRFLKKRTGILATMDT